MRPWLILVTLVAFCSGCTHIALERNTVKQASTLTDLQYQQVLDNLAMFACNPDAMAWHLKLSGGQVQVTDQATGTFSASIPSAVSDSVKALFNPFGSAQRGAVDQWNVVPAVDPDDLEVLQLAYQKALRPLDEDGAIRDAIYDHICEMAVKYNILLSHETIDKLLDHMKPEKGKPEDEEFQTKKWDLKRKFHHLQKQLDKQFDRLAELSRPLKPEDVTAHREKLNAGGQRNYTTAEAHADLQNQRTQQQWMITQNRLYVEDQIVKLIREICDLPYIPRIPATGRAEHNPAVIGQMQDKIKALMDLAEEPKFATPWICIGKKKDVPKCACYVGQYCNCGCDCYVWVMPENRAFLRDFTLTVLDLAPLETSEFPGFFPNAGVMYSPTTAGGGGRSR